MADVTLVLILPKRVKGCCPCDILFLEVEDPTKLVMFADGRQRLFLESKIQSIVELTPTSFEYTVVYDDVFLVDPGTPLLPCDIKTVCCENCRSRFLKSLVQTSVNTDDTIDGDGSLALPLTVPPSADANNLLGLGTDGQLLVDPMTVVGAGNQCGDVGSAFMIRSAVMDPATNELTLEGAAEHDTNINAQLASNGATQPVNNGQTATSGVQNQIINNPSLCRTLIIIDHVVGYFNCDLNSTGTWNYQITVDAALITPALGFTALASDPFWQGHLIASGPVNNSIVPGGTLNRNFEATFINTVADSSGTSEVTGVNLTVTSFFSTRA